MTQQNRRTFITAALATLSAPSLLRAQSEPAINPLVNRNVSGFMAQDWQEHFSALDRVSILCDTNSRSLHYWNPVGNDYRIYPTSVPQTNELTKRGYTKIVRKKVGPTWTPTVNMRKRDPSLPAFMPAGEGNPLGTHAMYLSWPAYLIHGTHDTRKIGRQSSSGCIGLFNYMIEELFEITPVGAQVRII
ncbi:L,D-transpeptidase [Neptunicoccus sediminis]|uniref:L,D-transpeptidase n=1 Tax=Neptunicoccus sediminis TaxID=1892596 RepID=UPI000845C906|nr:L,D-transpeptidase family protein [Neptunicoccus sediminis]